MIFNDVFKSTKDEEFKRLVSSLDLDVLIDLYDSFNTLMINVGSCQFDKNTTAFKYIDEIKEAQKFIKDGYNLDSRTYNRIRQIVYYQLHQFKAKELAQRFLDLFYPFRYQFPLVVDVMEEGFNPNGFDLRKFNIFEPIVDYYKKIRDLIGSAIEIRRDA